MEGETLPAMTDAPTAATSGPTDADILNEDWLRTTVWDLWTPDGKPVTTLAELAETLNTDPGTAAANLLRLPYGKAAPESLRAEAQAEVDGRSVGGVEVKAWTDLLREVYQRGVQSWPGETKTAFTAEEWALARVDGFLDRATEPGDTVSATAEDADLLLEAKARGVRHVRTQAGVRRYHAPIGSVIGANGEVISRPDRPGGRSGGGGDKKPSAPNPGWGSPYGGDGPSYDTDNGPVWMFRRSQRVRFYDESGKQVGPEHANVAPAMAWASQQDDWQNDISRQFGKPTSSSRGSGTGGKPTRPAKGRRPPSSDKSGRGPSRSKSATGVEPGSGKWKEAFAKIKVEGRKDGTGEIGDPVDVGDDVNEGARLLAEGKHIRLRQPDQVATLLAKITEMVDEAREKGDDAPTFDLCHVSVPGTNLFCAESKGIPRAKMPQLSGQARDGSPAAALRNEKKGGEANIEPLFRRALKDSGIKVTPQTVKASHLRASQSELDGPKVAGMTAAMEAGRVPDAPIFVTKDGYILDGHHRWASKVSLDAKGGELGKIEMPVEVVDMDIGALIDFTNEFALSMGIVPKGLGSAAEGTKPAS